jgi:malonate-semialdehyde dehydrogenase (acetylating)/methylmalonate-semialdehyde dehydrogenase
VYETGTKNGKRVQALGGAKNHMLVLPDADLDMAADAAVSAAYGSAGERCMAVSVVLAVDSVADALVEKLSSRIPNIKVGPGTDPAAEMGPLISREHRDKVASFVTNANAEGAKVVVDGTDKAKDAGFFLNPSLIDNVKPGMKCYDEEIFGPVLTVMRVKSYQEGLDTINANQFGNGTAIFTRDGGVARQFQLVVGRLRCSATSTCTDQRESTSLLAAKWLPHVGQTHVRRRSTWVSHKTANYTST